MRLFIFLLFLPVFSTAQNKHTILLDSFMKTQVDVKKFNGNVLVAQGGQIIYQKPFGYRNYGTKEALTNNSLFDLASVSKQFTAMAVLLLHEKGKLKLTDSLRGFFPELPYSNVTIRHMLTHTSGLPDYEDAMNLKWDRKKIAFNNDLIAFLAKEKVTPLFVPGSKWTYSNTAYALLSSIVEKVSGKSFATFLRENIFSPLDMTNTRIYNTRRSTKETIPDYALGFVYDDNLKKYVIADSVPQLDFVRYLDGITGDGVVNSTTADLLKWDNALKSNKLLSPQLQQEMLSAQASVDSAGRTSYGYGVFISKDKYGEKIFHSGGWPGYVTFMQRYPKEDLTIIVLSNNGSNSPALTNQLSYLMHDEKVRFPYVHKPAAVKDTALEKYAGTYRGEDAKVDIVKMNGKLYRKGAKDIELVQESKNTFFYADGSDRHIEFTMNDKGLVENAIFVIDGMTFVRTKEK